MAGFIQYLYEYQNGERVRNVGFMKVDNQMDKTVIQIYAKQIDEVTGIQFQREDGSKYLATWEPSEEGQESPREPQPIIAPPSPQPRLVQPVMPPAPQEPPRPMPQMQEEVEDVASYIPSTTRRCEKIQRQDLSRLPRKEWRLANNSFLLHGFYNYHHLLYIEEDDKVWIGVPGIYHEKEKAAANAFGFTEFQRLTDLEVELSEEEKNTYEDFGYWCRQVEHS